MTTSSQHWSAQARYDMDTARAMFDSGRYLYVLFCCQQAVEKMIKAIIASKTKELPPRIHQLMRLADVTELDFGGDTADFLRELSSYYIQTRIPRKFPTSLPV